MKYILYIFSILSFASCVSTIKTDYNLKSFDSLEVGISDETAISAVGTPSEKFKDPKNENKEDWFYLNDEKTIQYATLTVDIKNKKVISVLIVPHEGDAENSLDYLLKEKFAKMTFKKYKIKRCNRHYIPSTFYYISVDGGVIIKGDSNFSEAVQYSKVTTDYAKKYIQLIDQCKI